MNELDKKRLDNLLREVRSERFACQSIARQALPNERVSKCLRMPRINTHVELWKHLETEKLFYNNLIVCGSVWHCPICAAKISERRKLELRKAFESHKSSGGKVALLTLTFSHKKHDNLKDILDRFRQAVQSFYRGKDNNQIRSEVSLIGKVGCLEVTHGFANSWHPHRHDVWFMTNDADMNAIKNKLYKLWRRALKKHGLTANEKHGLDFQSGEEAEEYLAKHGTWSLEQEMSKSHIKKGKQNSFTPFDLLRQYFVTEEDLYINLFKEYAEVFKGKQQLQWSPGLKKHFGIDEKTDEVLAQEKEERSMFFGLITLDQWKLILKYEKRAAVLDSAEKHGYEEGLKRVYDDLLLFENKIAKKNTNHKG